MPPTLRFPIVLNNLSFWYPGDAFGYPGAAFWWSWGPSLQKAKSLIEDHCPVVFLRRVTLLLACSPCLDSQFTFGSIPVRTFGAVHLCPAVRFDALFPGGTDQKWRGADFIIFWIEASASNWLVAQLHDVRFAETLCSSAAAPTPPYPTYHRHLLWEEIHTAWRTLSLTFRTGFEPTLSVFFLDLAAFWTLQLIRGNLIIHKVSMDRQLPIFSYRTYKFRHHTFEKRYKEN